jgi:hypothetical protein
VVNGRSERDNNLSVVESGDAPKLHTDLTRLTKAEQLLEELPQYGDLPKLRTDLTKLTEAEQLLEALPLDYVPGRTRLPQGSRIGLVRPNRIFIGREDELKALASNIKASASTEAWEDVTVVVTGLGGIGKAHLAREFVYRYGQFFLGGVFWLSFRDPNAVPAEVAACWSAVGAELLDTNFGSRSLGDQVRGVMSAWLSELPRLLVFEHCEDIDLLEQWRPRSDLGSG